MKDVATFQTGRCTLGSHPRRAVFSAQHYKGKQSWVSPNTSGKKEWPRLTYRPLSWSNLGGVCSRSSAPGGGSLRKRGTGPQYALTTATRSPSSPLNRQCTIPPRRIQAKTRKHPLGNRTGHPIPIANSSLTDLSFARCAPRSTLHVFSLAQNLMDACWDGNPAVSVLQGSCGRLRRMG